MSPSSKRRRISPLVECNTGTAPSSNGLYAMLRIDTSEREGGGEREIFKCKFAEKVQNETFKTSPIVKNCFIQVDAELGSNAFSVLMC